MENMLTRLKNRVMTAVGSDLPALPTVNQSHQNVPSHRHLPDKFTYCRPPFLQLVTQDELKASSDHNVRPIIVPRDLSVMPWGSDAGCGYAECVNSGKSEWNEDQAFFQRQVLTHPNKLFADVPYIYFGIYDGHAGYGAALAAQMQFHFILHEKLVDTIDLLMPRIHNAASQSNPVPGGPILLEPLMFHKAVSLDELIIGALESAFHEMDAIIAGDRDKYANAGGCTACAALFICGKLYVSNAGDSRATLCQRLPVKRRPNRSEEGKENLPNGDEDREAPEFASFPVPFSFDHTPDTERARLMTTGKLNPNFMGGEYLAMEYAKKPLTKDLGTRILYRRETMKGEWTLVEFLKPLNFLCFQVGRTRP
jgi:protein phosphatase 1H